ncbi:alpha/beta hydrolase, partial [Frankia sp. AgW1.1]|nr:alpha/beta hydrolase [Frankia sp. AgW1.1]MBL7625239.1 hypothetical protein [Frankia sp. AgB1.8]
AAGVPTELHLFPGTFHGSGIVGQAAISQCERAEAKAVLAKALGLIVSPAQPAHGAS